MRQTFTLALLLCCQMVAWAGDFFTTRQVTFREGRYRADVEFPVNGNAEALAQVKLWLCDALDMDAPPRLRESDFRKLLGEACKQFEDENATGTRLIEVVRSYEDETIVTFESRMVDTDDETWTTEDCATFSKRDGHRLTLKEIFACNEQGVKQLMWNARGQLRLDVDKPESLVVGNCGITDGWVVVIGPAHNSIGSAFRIKYETAEPYLRKSKDGKYY